MSELFDLWLEREACAAGDMVRGKVVFPDPSDERLAKVQKVTVLVRARVHGSGNREQVTVLEDTLCVGPVTVPELRFSATLPQRGPVSWEGRHVKVSWEVIAQLDIPWAIDPKHVRPFTVVPRQSRGS